PVHGRRRLWQIPSAELSLIKVHPSLTTLVKRELEESLQKSGQAASSVRSRTTVAEIQKSMADASKSDGAKMNNPSSLESYIVRVGPIAQIGRVCSNYQSNLFGQYFSAKHEAEEAGFSEIRGNGAAESSESNQSSKKTSGRRFLHRLLGLRDRLRRRKKSSKIFSPSEHRGPGTDGGCRQQTAAVAELRQSVCWLLWTRRLPPSLVADLRLRASRQLLRDQLMDSAERLVASCRCSQEAPRAEAELLESPAGPAPGGLLATTAQVHQGSVTAATASGRPARPNGLLIR
uniref:Guanylate cyclase domain-containing protein n=1 Tax=Macrostomum lignano TaxID=282301 RepID=A0A1I8F9V2_9PLAT